MTNAPGKDAAGQNVLETSVATTGVVVSLAHALEVVGVETPGQLERLQTLGCGVGQGENRW